MDNLFVFLVSFIFIFIIYVFFYITKRKKGTLKNNKEFNFLINKFKLNKNKLNYNRLGLLFAFINSLIISVTGTVCTMVKMKLIWQLIIAFVMIMGLIYSIYGIIGQVLQRKVGIKDDERKRNRK